MLYFTIQNRFQDGTSKVSAAAGSRWRFCVRDYRRISAKSSLVLAEALTGSFRSNLELQDFVAGAVFGEVGGWLDWLRALEMTFHMRCGWRMRFILRGRRSISWGWRGDLIVAGEALRDILGDFRSAKSCSLQYNFVSKMRSSLVPEAAGARWRFYRRIMLGYPRISSNRLSYVAAALQGVSAQILSFKICVAGAVFGEVGGWLYLLDALEMTFHMWRRSVMTFILRGRRSIWWCWRVTLLAPRIGNDVSYVTQISDDIHFAWQAQYLVMLEGDFTCSTHWKWRFKEVPEQYVVVLCSTE